MHGAGAVFSSRPAPYFYYKYRIIRYLHFYRGAGPEHFFAPAPSDLCHLCMPLNDRPEELKEEIFKRLFKTAEIAPFTPEERIKYENYMTTERDIQNYISYAREKGIEEGRAEGIMEGMEKGIMEGMEKGREEGRAEGMANAARNMLAEGFSIDLVVKCTGLSKEQIEMLKT